MARPEHPAAPRDSALVPFPRLLDDDEHATALDRHPWRDGYLRHAARLRRAQLVLHFHRFDDDHSLPRGDLVSLSDQHPDHTAGHRCGNRPFAVGVYRGVRPTPAGTTSVDADEDGSSVEAHEELGA